MPSLPCGNSSLNYSVQSLFKPCIMIHEPEYVKELLRKYLHRQATPREVNLLMLAWDIYDDDELVEMIEAIAAELPLPGTEETMEQEEVAGAAVAPVVAKPLRMRVWGRWVVAIIVVCLLAGAIGFLWLRKAPEPAPVPLDCKGASATTLPASIFSAHLVLASDSVLLLDSSTPNGLIARQGNMEIVQSEPGLIEYKINSNRTGNKKRDAYHTLQTGAGRQFRVKLVNGSTIRLNASSELKFPVNGNNSPSLLLVGEALFEAAARSKQPIYVATYNSQIMGVGARFNVRSYSKNHSVATVLQGRASVESALAAATPEGGQQAIVHRMSSYEKDAIITAPADTAATVSWTQAMRVYNSASMREFVADMGRLLDLQMVNVDCVPARLRISGSFCYNMSVDELLHNLEERKVKFTQRGNQIIFCVTPEASLQRD